MHRDRNEKPEEFAIFVSFVGIQSIRICMADYVIELAYGKLDFDRKLHTFVCNAHKKIG